ncbi:MAG: hypothetical protein AAGH99_09105 [Planctomycetota bacterium]
MSTPGSTATLSKKERKALRKQMMEKKEQLLAKHGRSDKALGSSRPFSDIKPKLPADPPKPKLPTWTPPEPKRTLAAITPKPASTRDRSARRRSLRPRVRDEVRTQPAPAYLPGAGTLPGAGGVRDLDHTGPGPLTRFAAALENTGRGIARLWRDRPWRDTGDQTRGETHRTLSLMIKPLRTLGIVAVPGALVLGRELRLMGASDTGSLVVLGMGLSLAVGLLALAEIAGALRTIVRRL